MGKGSSSTMDKDKLKRWVSDYVTFPLELVWKRDWRELKYNYVYGEKWYSWLCKHRTCKYADNKIHFAHKGHCITDDHCGKPEHRFCEDCGVRFSYAPITPWKNSPK